MRRYVPVTLDRHSSLAWKRFDDFGFCSADHTAPIVLAELAKASVSMPVGFTRSDEGYQLAVLLGIEGSPNLFVTQSGRWVGSYVPASFRGYPFTLVPSSVQGEAILSVDEDGPCVGPAGGLEWDQAFFTSQGKVAQLVSQIVWFLKQVHASEEATHAAVAALDEQGLIVPWALSLETAAGLRGLHGVYRVDDEKLARLGGDALEALHRAGALMLAHAQILSMQKLDLLQQLFDDRGTMAEPQAAGAYEPSALSDVELGMPGSGFSFENL